MAALTYLTHQASRRRSGGDRSVWIYGSAVALQPCNARLFCSLCEWGVPTALLASFSSLPSRQTFLDCNKHSNIVCSQLALWRFV